MNRYIGIDVHQDECHATVQDENGETVKRGEFEDSPSGFEDFFDWVRDAEVAIEAGDTWQPVYDWLAESGFVVKLADPRKVRIIAEVKIKTDARGSEALAGLLRADLIPEVYVPSKERRGLREIVKRRAKLVMEGGEFFNRIRAEFRIKRIETDLDLRTDKVKKWVKDLEIDALDDYLEVVKILDERIEKLEKEIKEIAGEMEEGKLLMTILYVGYFSALTIVAEIATIERFPASGHLCSY